MQDQFKVANSSTSPTQWVGSWNSTTGQIDEVVFNTTGDGALDFGNSTARDAAIVKMNAYSGNAFIGHVPPPPHH